MWCVDYNTNILLTDSLYILIFLLILLIDSLYLYFLHNDKTIQILFIIGMSAASTPSEAMSASVSSVGNALKHPSAMLVISGGEGYVDFRIGKWVVYVKLLIQFSKKILSD